ncbi:MAG: aldo/keto reductase [Fermentimonas sp.]|jgi:aryl-alcohol dehydrogenase-like predicted oxidoreductase|uniref:Putative aldo-keto reductase 2 n=1 Tax=Fermentimonas caenicola TaxID=1562970 RepID=A0A098BZR2_9BACT|nr:aldo/keto reductase [Fermentimonas sp.]MBP7104046.1 aldo/keto reductase [Fermentimonas sp.]MCK9501775.1 aldo/keto reductase [Lascolabacillus sp.]MDI9624915.1 aldo/keto reductase [Bacteroidota bacterium]CEA15658.1 putative aldo-keto reductase 2 [Fermentimonas caenicola]
MKTIKQMNLGSQGLVIPTIGLGCMGMSKMNGAGVYGKADDKESIATIHRSFDLGGNFLDTADIYGLGENERLVAKAVSGNRDKYIIATKFGVEIDNDGNRTGRINGTKSYMRKAIERSLRNLNTDYIDLYYLHRLDINTPVEETVAAMAELVEEGKVRYIGLSEVGSETIRKAHGVYPLTAVQSEYSLFERQIEMLGILDTLKELGIGLISYSPLGRGFLSGTIKNPNELEEGDWRRNTPRFQLDQFNKNSELLDKIKQVAAEKNITPSQLALAWVIAKGHVPIPGTKRIKYVEENIAAANITLSQENIDLLESIIPLGTDTGDRYANMSGVNL